MVPYVFGKYQVEMQTLIMLHFTKTSVVMNAKLFASISVFFMLDVDHMSVDPCTQAVQRQAWHANIEKVLHFVMCQYRSVGDMKQYAKLLPEVIPDPGYEQK